MSADQSAYPGVAQRGQHRPHLGAAGALRRCGVKFIGSGRPGRQVGASARIAVRSAAGSRTRAMPLSYVVFSHL